MQYESPISSGLKVMAKVKVFQKSRSQSQKSWHPVKSLVIMNTHMKYESSIFSGWKVMAKVKVCVHAANADADGRAMTLAARTFVPAR